MADIAPALSSLLVSGHSAPIQKHVHVPDRLDSFLQEAYRINAHISSLLAYLRQIRQPYLSTSAPPPSSRRTNRNPSSASSTIHLTDSQRAEIDTQTSTLLHDLSGNISSLTAAENLRNSTETALLERRFGKANKNSLLWRWAAGDDHKKDEVGKSAEQLDAEGRAIGTKACREGILWYLGWRLQSAVDLQRGMIEVRASREREKEKSVLWKMKVGEVGAGINLSGNGVVAGGQIPRRTDGGGLGTETNYKLHPQFHPSLEESQDEALEDGEKLSPALRQLLALENSNLLTYYDSQLSKIAQAEKSLLDISSLQSTLVAHLATQGEMIDQLVSDAQGTGENVKRANKELKRAGERWGKGLARSVFWGTVALCGFLVGWDLVF